MKKVHVNVLREFSSKTF